MTFIVHRSDFGLKIGLPIRWTRVSDQTSDERVGRTSRTSLTVGEVLYFPLTEKEVTYEKYLLRATTANKMFMLAWGDV